jgi:RNA polymerase sigma-70 factor, ECF subfamily
MEQLRKRGFSDEALPLLDSVYRFALRLTEGRAAEAEDLAQETFLLAYRSWDSFAPGTNCRAWLFTICRNVHLGQLRKAARRPKEVPEDATGPGTEGFAMRQAWEASDQQDPEEELFGKLVDEEVLRAVDALAEPFREVVVLSDLQGMSHAEIAEVLDLPPGTVKSRLFRGRRALHDSLYDYAVEMGYIRREGS